MSKPGHNSRAKGPFSNERLKSFIDRIERVEEERKALGGDIRDIYAEAKGVGYDVGTMRKVIRLRAMSDADRAEQQALLETYLHALGMVDRIDARLESGESQREIAAAEGVSKSTVQRRGPKVVSFPASSKMDHPKPEDGDDGITVPSGGPTVVTNAGGSHEVGESTGEPHGQPDRDCLGVGADETVAASGPCAPNANEAPTTPSVGAVKEITLAPKPASVLPAPTTWKEITSVREAQEAAVEAERERKREVRRLAMARVYELAKITDADMPEQPPFLRRTPAQGRAGT